MFNTESNESNSIDLLATSSLPISIFFSFWRTKESEVQSSNAGNRPWRDFNISTCVYCERCGVFNVSQKLSMWCNMCVVQCACGAMCVWCNMCVLQCACGAICVWCNVCVVQYVCGAMCVWCHSIQQVGDAYEKTISNIISHHITSHHIIWMKIDWV